MKKLIILFLTSIANVTFGQAVKFGSTLIHGDNAPQSAANAFYAKTQWIYRAGAFHAVSDQDALDLRYAFLASPTFTGTPTAPTPSPVDSSTKLATTAFVKAQGYAVLPSLGTTNQQLRINAGATALEYFTPTAGTGTVTSVSIVTANGISGSVATSTTTPAITLSLGAITPSSINTGDIMANTPNYTGVGGVRFLVWNASTDRFEKISSLLQPNTTITADYTARDYDYTIRVDCTSGPVNVTLPTSNSLFGLVYNIKKIDNTTNIVTIIGTVDGQVNPTITMQYARKQIQFNGTDWDILN